MKNRLKNKIMTRIYFEYGKNIVRNNFAYILAGIFVFTFVASISLFDILNNLYHTDPSALWNFTRVAFRDAEIITLLLFGATTLSAILAALKAFKIDVYPARFRSLAH